MVEVFRTKSAKLLNAIVNSPSVRPTAEMGTDEVDTSAVLANADNICVADRHGGAVLFVADGDGVYTGHIFCVEGARGSKALALGRAALAMLFEGANARLLEARVPLQLPAARFLCRRLGMVSTERTAEEEIFNLEIA